MVNKRTINLVKQETIELKNAEVNTRNYPEGDLDHINEYIEKNMDRYIDTISLIPGFPDSKQMKILDCGIAYGYHDVVLKRLGYEVYGSEQKERINNNCVIPMREGIKVKDINLTTDDLNFQEDFFDVVIFGEVIEHIRDSPVRALKRVKRLLKPGGYLIYTTPNFCRITNLGMLIFKRNPFEPFDLNYDAQSSKHHITDAWTHIREYNKQELIDITKLAGFSILKIKMSRCWDTYDFNYRYGNFSKGKRSVSLLLSLMNYIFKNYRSDIMLLCQKPS